MIVSDSWPSSSLSCDGSESQMFNFYEHTIFQSFQYHYYVCKIFPLFVFSCTLINAAHPKQSFLFKVKLQYEHKQTRRVSCVHGNVVFVPSCT